MNQCIRGGGGKLVDDVSTKQIIGVLHSWADRSELNFGVRHDEQRDSGARRIVVPYKVVRMFQNVTQYRLLNSYRRFEGMFQN